MIDYTISVLSTVLVSLPLGTNLALLHFMWMLVSGYLSGVAGDRLIGGRHPAGLGRFAERGVANRAARGVVA